MAAVAEESGQPESKEQSDDAPVQKDSSQAKERIFKINSIDEFDDKFEALKESMVLIDFTASWCAPCQKMKKVLPDLMTKYPDFSVFEVDVDLDDNEDVVEKYGPESMPTLVFIKKGEQIMKESGFKDKDQLEGRIKQHFYGDE